jgi:hypothetical protein
VRTFRPNEIVTLSKTWPGPDGGPWLLTYQLAEVDGRLECVGFEIRSYLRVVGEDELGEKYSAYVEGPLTIEEARLADRVVDESWTPPPRPPEGKELEELIRERAARGLKTPSLGEIGWPQVRPELKGVWAALEEHDREALSVDAEHALKAPRPLQATLFRSLSFATELTDVRRNLAEHLRRRDEFLKQIARDWDAINEDIANDLAPWGGEHKGPPAGARDLFAEGSPESLEAAEALAASGGKARKPGQYSRADLEHVAKAYTAACRGVSPTAPTKHVEALFGLSTDQARKVVHRCREMGLLPRTEKYKARGWDRGEAPWEGDQKG